MSNERGNDQSLSRLGDSIRRAYPAVQLSTDQHHVHMARLGIHDRHHASPQQDRRRRVGAVELAAMLLVVAVVVVGVVIWNAERPDQNHSSGASGLGTPTASATSTVSRAALERATRPLTPGEGRHFAMSVSADYRLDGSSFLQWNTDIWERIRPDGTYQLRITARNPKGEVVGWFVRNGDQWTWDQRGWIEKGSVSAGIIQLPEELRIVYQELHVLPVLLSGSAPGNRATPTAEGISRISSSSSDVGSIGQQLGIDAVKLTQELRLRSATDRVLDAETLIETRSGKSLSLGTYTFSGASTMPASSINDSQFTVSTLGADASTHYAMPNSLPLGLTVTAHSDVASAAEMQYTLGGDSVSVRLSVYPSRGGVDIRTWKRISASGTTFHTTDSSNAKIYWTSKSGRGVPQQAIWDSGRFRFELSSASHSTTSGWGESQLVSLVDALTRKSSK